MAGLWLYEKRALAHPLPNTLRVWFVITSSCPDSCVFYVKLPHSSARNSQCPIGPCLHRCVSHLGDGIPITSPAEAIFSAVKSAVTASLKPQTGLLGNVLTCPTGPEIPSLFIAFHNDTLKRFLVLHHNLPRDNTAVKKTTTRARLADDRSVRNNTISSSSVRINVTVSGS